MKILYWQNKFFKPSLNGRDEMWSKKDTFISWSRVTPRLTVFDTRWCWEELSEVDAKLFTATMKHHQPLMNIISNINCSWNHLETSYLNCKCVKPVKHHKPLKHCLQSVSEMKSLLLFCLNLFLQAIIMLSPHKCFKTVKTVEGRGLQQLMVIFLIFLLWFCICMTLPMINARQIVEILNYSLSH